MRGDKNTHSKGERVKIPLLPNNEGKRSGTTGSWHMLCHSRQCCHCLWCNLNVLQQKQIYSLNTPVPVFFRFQLKWEYPQGRNDDTALDLIKLICNDRTMIYGKPENSAIGIFIFFNIYGENYDRFGDWGQIITCPSGQYYDAAEFR